VPHTTRLPNLLNAMHDSPTIRGAYGFRLLTAAGEPPLPHLLDVPADAPAVTLSWVHAPAAENELEVDEQHVRMAHAGGGLLEVRRAEGTVRLELPQPATADAIVHPLMTAPLAIHARWRGNVALHAGAVLIEGAAFAICGQQTAGKSTTLATLADRGFPIVADDLLVVDGAHVLSGPACIDLRPDTAERFPAARYLGIIGDRPRHRLATAGAPASVPLGGAFVLGWHDAPEPVVEPLSMSEKLELLHGQDYASVAGPPDPEQVFRLLDVPMWRLRRRRDWAGTDGAMGALIETAAAQAVASHA
jgi:hypothetical protein